MKTMSLISCKMITMNYENHTAVDAVSFDVEKGDYVCIVGKNGSGKSTLMKGLLGLQPLHSGSIEFAPGLARTDIGYLPQQTAVQRDFPASVAEVVLSGSLNRIGWKPFYSQKEKKRALSRMEEMGVDALSEKSYRELSGGQQQRVLLARALCATEQVLLLDEPVTGLDPLATAEFYYLLDKLHKEGVTIIMVSHDIESVLSQAQKIIHMGTKLLFAGTVEDYLESPAGKRFLGRAAQ